MLNLLRRIIQEISQANKLSQVLNIIVTQVKKGTKADVCSIYLQQENNSQQYVLMATDGLNPSGVGHITLNIGKGLVGYVAQKGDLINTAQAQKHPRFHLFQELEEGDYNGFSAIPITNHKRVMGVLVIQSKKSQEFSQDIVDFLLTITAQLSTLINYALALDSIPTIHHTHQPLIGSPASPGVAIGRATQIICCHELSKIPDRICQDIQLEKEKFNSAIAKVKEEIHELNLRLEKENLPTEDIAIFDAYLLMLESSSFVNKTLEYINTGNWAPGALRKTIEEHQAYFKEIENSYFQERIKDITDLGQRVLDKLSGNENAQEIKENTILVGEDFSAMILSKINAKQVKGIISMSGSQTSHIAIIARAIGIPTVMGVTDLPIRQIEGCELIVDGYSGKIYISPDKKVRKQYIQFEQQELNLTSTLKSLKEETATTLDNVTIPLYINFGSEEHIEIIKNCGADGIGLFRTEFLFMSNNQFPGEKKQIRLYKKILDHCSPKPVMLRTLDIGGDKSLSYFPIEEENPFLGWRGIRVSLDHPEIFIIQLRAMLIANIGNDNLNIMFPMISNINEIEECKLLLAKARAELIEEGYQVDLPKVGIMIEVPSLIFQISQIAELVDFISIGSNDLVQYLLAVDRNNPNVALLYEPLQPAVIAAIYRIIKDAREASLRVSICGEMASDPLACILLMGMEIDNLSINLSSLGRIKWVIRNFTQSEAKHALNHVLKLNNADQVRDFLKELLEQKGMAGLFRAGG